VLQERFGVSGRRACAVVGQPRLAPPVLTEDELALRAWLRQFSKDPPRWGRRRAPWRPPAANPRLIQR